MYQATFSISSFLGNPRTWEAVSRNWFLPEVSPLLFSGVQKKRENKEEKKNIYKTEEIYSSKKSVSNALASGTLTLAQQLGNKSQVFFLVFLFHISAEFICQKSCRLLGNLRSLMDMHFQKPSLSKNWGMLLSVPAFGK